MISSVPHMTDIGSSLLLRAVSGEVITFTRFKIGDGTLPDGQDGSGLFDLIHPIVDFQINDMDTSDRGAIKLTGTFDSSAVSADFEWREFGIFCRGEDGVEQLYAYANDGQDAGMMRALQTDYMAEQTITLIIAIGNAEHVTAIVAPNQQYASKNELNNHTNNKQNPHVVTKEQVGLGNVVNVTPANMTIAFSEPENQEQEQGAESHPLELGTGERLQVLLGKLKAVVRRALEHMADKNNPHGVTTEQIEAADAEHKHNAADIEDGVLPVARGGTGVETVDGLKNLIGTNAFISVYSGDGTQKRLIPTGFKPSAVILCNARGQTYSEDDGVCGGVAVGNYGVVSLESTSALDATTWNDDMTALLIAETGFWVNYAENADEVPTISTNKEGETYRFIAYR